MKGSGRMKEEEREDRERTEGWRGGGVEGWSEQWKTRLKGHTRNTPINPTGCRIATAKQHRARMIPANEGNQAPTTTGGSVEGSVQHLQIRG